MKVGDEVIYKLSAFDGFYARNGKGGTRGVKEFKGKRIGVVVQVVEHDNQVRFIVVKPTKILSPVGCKPIKTCMDVVRPWEVKKRG